MREPDATPEGAPGLRPDRWIGVEFKHLTTLLAVAEEGSFRAAGDRLGYAQPAISQHIAQLELAVGVRLIHRSRGPGPASLTEAGRVLKDHGECIVAELRAARADVEALRASAIAPKT